MSADSFLCGTSLIVFDGVEPSDFVGFDPLSNPFQKRSIWIRDSLAFLLGRRMEDGSTDVAMDEETLAQLVCLLSTTQKRNRQMQDNGVRPEGSGPWDAQLAKIGASVRPVVCP